MNVSVGGPKAQEALRVLKQHIISGEWPVNSQIPKEPELMELLEVGKSTVREAVRSLAAVGMLEPIKGVGTFVRSRTPVSGVVSQFMEAYDLDDLLGFRRALEIEAAQLAALNRTDQHLELLERAHASALDTPVTPRRTIEGKPMPGSFHQVVVEASGNRLIASLYSSVMTAIRTYQNRGLVAHGVDAEVRQQDHEQLLEAIRDQDLRRAAHVMTLHVDRDLVDPKAAGIEQERLALLTGQNEGGTRG